MIQVLINNIDQSSIIERESLTVNQNITDNVDNAKFTIRKYGSRTYIPVYGEEVKIYDDATQIFGGIIRRVKESVESGADGIVYDIECSDYTAEMDNRLVAQTYENKTIKEIITDILSLYAPTFNANAVNSDFLIAKIVFNQVKISQCIRKLADIVKYEWYVDETKTVHFFIETEISAPFNLTDTSGNYISTSLERNLDGSTIVNRVKVRGGEYSGSTYTDKITVSGSNSKSFSLPYKFDNLTVKLNTVAQTIGVDNIDDFTTKDVLYNFQEKTIRWENELSDADVIEFSGNPRIRVFAVAEDSESIALYGKIEKLIREDDIKDNTVARNRALAELYAYSNNVIDAKFETRTPGLRAGMSINLNSTKRACDDTLVIKTVSFRALDPNTFGYKVECVSGKRYGLLQILAKLLEPKPLDIDETEINEEIFSDNAVLTITEEHEMVMPVEDTATITISENNIVIGTEPDWVLADYHPTSQLDPKRQGRLDYSLQVY